MFFNKLVEFNYQANNLYDFFKQLLNFKISIKLKYKSIFYKLQKV